MFGQVNTSLRVLNLYGTRIGDAGAQHLAEALQVRFSLGGRPF